MSASISSPASKASGPDARSLWLALSALTVLCVAVFALRFGLRPTSWVQIWAALGAFDPTDADQIVIRAIRAPRVLGAALAGAALGIAGALMQGMTRNPLADPGLLGVNAGASLGVVLCILIFGITDPAHFFWIALGGACAAAVLVFLLGGGAAAAPARLILAGAAVSALFLALGRALLLVSQQTLDVYRFWVLGGFDGIDIATLTALLPFFAVGIVLAILASLSLNALMLGEDTARGLGVRVGGAQILTGAAIVTLCAATVSMAGPIAFVGLIIPHLARWIAGADIRWVLAFSATMGAGLMITADLLGRLPLFGGNMQAGVMSALIGGPVLVLLVRRNGETNS